MNFPRVATMLLLVASLFVLVACRIAPSAPPTAETAAPLPQPEAGKLTVVDVRARPAPMAGGNGAVYLTVLNGLDRDVRLVSAASAAADVVETHETVEEQGVMKMIMLPDGYEIPSGAALELKPGGKHIMLIGLVQPLNPGDSLEVTLNFDDGETMTVTASVVEMTLSMPMGEGMATPTP